MTRDLVGVCVAIGLLSSPVVAGASNPDGLRSAATVNIDIDARIEGRSAFCEGKMLILRSREADDYIQQHFGRSDHGFRFLDESDLRHAMYGKSPFASFSTKDRCRFGGSFKKVVPGEYYAVALVSAPEQAASTYDYSARVGAVLMRRITVSPGVRARFELKDR